MTYLHRFGLAFILLLLSLRSPAQIKERWDKSISDKTADAKTQWFSDAKFGLFLHWGLYSQLAGVWNGKKYYGTSEWVMHRGKIPAKDYAKLMNEFNPVKFNADEWVALAKEFGIKYMVLTSKHHEGFAMFNSKVSDFNITNSPFKRDPLKELSVACQKGNMKLGFYYSQFLDWHEPNGGGNDWDFVEKDKNFKAYYTTKSIPQLKELASNYGPLGLIWCDMPGGLSKEETQGLIEEIRNIQPNCLLSSRVGQGLGDFRDFGDGEVPATVVKGPWEAIATHNDSWGYSTLDFNFKTSSEIIRLLTSIVSKGGNLMLNIGPKADGTFPETSVACLKEVGKWLNVNGDAIYGTTYGPIAPQPWGVTTLKPGKLFLHVTERPENGVLLVPGVDAKVKSVAFLADKKTLTWDLSNKRLTVKLPNELPDKVNTVLVVEYEGKISDSFSEDKVIVSPEFKECKLDIVKAKPAGATKVETITYSNYFGDWKHTLCATNMKAPADSVVYNVEFTRPGDYKVSLEYSSPLENSKQEGVLQVGKEVYYFETLATGEYDAWHPLIFIKQSVAMVRIREAGIKQIRIAPIKEGKELFKLSRISIEPFE